MKDFEYGHSQWADTTPMGMLPEAFDENWEDDPAFDNYAEDWDDDDPLEAYADEWDDDDPFESYGEDWDEDEIYGDAAIIPFDEARRRRLFGRRARRSQRKLARMNRFIRRRPKPKPSAAPTRAQSTNATAVEALKLARKNAAIAAAHERKFVAASKALREANKLAANNDKKQRQEIDKIKQSAQTSALMGMMMGPPAINSIKPSSDTQIKPGSDLKIDDVDYKSDPMRMMLPMLMSQGGLGSGSGDNSLMMMMLMMSMGQNSN